jgi:CheY-like chemotaxis protein/anti-sigma regulatory factor (Ser/Thr protein kinase)
MEAGGHQLEVDLPARAVVLHADAERMTQVLTNLLSNACRFTDPGGRITLSASVREGQLEIAVTDNGIGIPPAQRERIFEMFSQGHERPEDSRGGLGVGLTLVKHIVHLHGGTVEVRSEGAGRGSTFVVRIPASHADGARPAPSVDAPAGAAAPNSGRRILVADDNRDSAETLAMLLRLEGSQVVTAYDGEQALKLFHDTRPQVVLLDIGMPKVSGYDACREIRALSGADRPIIVALTGWGSEEDRRRSREAGFDGHLIKPVDPAVLLRFLNEHEPG